MDDDDMSGWAHQLELEQRQLEEEMLAADPGYLECLQQLEREHENE